jgi:hypothetical protein
MTMVVYLQIVNGIYMKFLKLIIWVTQLLIHVLEKICSRLFVILNDLNTDARTDKPKKCIHNRKFSDADIKNKMILPIEALSHLVTCYRARQNGEQTCNVDVQHALDQLYASFEDRFRGSRDEIKMRLEVYLP